MKSKGGIGASFKMFIRDFFFLVVILGGFATLAFNLVPPKHGFDQAYATPSIYQQGDFLQTVNLVDSSFEKAWSKGLLKAADEAGDLAIARRIALGLMGTIPSLEEIRRIESLPEGKRITWWIDQVLHDQRFADYLGERLTRAFVGTEDGPFILFRRRKFKTWLSEQIIANVPYDQMVREIISSEGIWTENPSTNFITVTAQKDKSNQPDPVRLAGRVTRAFLGLRLDCAQCHDHPFAPWKQSDFESFSAFFGQTHIGFRGVYDGAGEYSIDDKRKGVKRTISPKVAFSQDLLPENGTLRGRLSKWVTDPHNKYFSQAAVNRIWAILCGVPMVSPVDNLEADSNVPEALKIMAEDFASHGYDLGRLIRIMVSTKIYRSQSMSKNDDFESAERAWAQFPLTRLRPEQVAGAILQAASISTINADSHIITRLLRLGEQNDFISRYGDNGDDEFDGRGGTIPQRLVMMNGKLVSEKTKGGPFSATTRIHWLAFGDEMSIEAVYLAALTRRPSREEFAYFEDELKDKTRDRGQIIQDIFWALINSTEFSWNH